MDLTAFAELARKRTPTAGKVYSSLIIRENASYEKKDATQTARQNFLIFGRFDENIARASWSQRTATYAVPRIIGEHIAQLTPPKVAIVHSHLGNGKSILFAYAKFLAAQNNLEVFSIRATATEPQFLAAIDELPPGAIVLFEGDVFYLSGVLKKVVEKNLVLCATSRSTTTRVALPPLSRAAGELLRVFDVNKLTPVELANFHDLVDSMAFWPQDLSRLTRADRLERLARQYDSSVSAITLKIFENAEIRQAVLEQWKNSVVLLRPILDHFVVQSYMQMIDISVPSYLLNEFQNADYSVLTAMENDIIRVSFSGNIAFGNAIIGEFIFRNYEKKEDLIGAVVRFANFIDEHPTQKDFQWVIRRLLRYWNLRRLLNSSTLPKEVFDRASYIPNVSADPLFWVQYSMSEMENGNFLPADRFLTTAYTKAANRGVGFDTYQIDTHAARLTVRKISVNGFFDGASAAILTAVRKLKAVVDRRPDDTYHVATVVSQLLKLEVPWNYTLNERDYGFFRKDLMAIGDRLLAGLGAAADLFTSEREALDLIRSKLEHDS